MGEYAEAEQHLQEAWRLAPSEKRRFMARILFLRAGLAMLRREPAERYLGQFKTLFERGIQPALWRNISVREHLRQHLPECDFLLLDAICAAINAPEGLIRLNALPAWQAPSRLRRWIRPGQPGRGWAGRGSAVLPPSHYVILNTAVRFDTNCGAVGCSFCKLL
jgi:hypothetical protein